MAPMLARNGPLGGLAVGMTTMGGTENAACNFYRPRRPARGGRADYPLPDNRRGELFDWLGAHGRRRLVQGHAKPEHALPLSLPPTHAQPRSARTVEIEGFAIGDEGTPGLPLAEALILRRVSMPLSLIHI